MEPRDIFEHKNYWDRHFASKMSTPIPISLLPNWISRLLDRTRITISGKVLEVGCGSGDDTTYLIKSGYDVTALDLSMTALKRVALKFQEVCLVNHALPEPLPFIDAAFDNAVAGLSLHYFKWAETVEIIMEIRRVLGAEGTLIFRVNSTKDIHYGYGKGDEIEENFFASDGRYKRFFTEADCRKLFQHGWRLETLLPMTEFKYGKPKYTWAGLCTKL